MHKKVYFVFIFSLSILNISAQDSKLDLVFEDLIPIEFYTQLQFPQCNSDPSFSNFQIEEDYAGTVSDFTNISDHKILERQSKKLRDFQQQQFDYFPPFKCKEIEEVQKNTFFNPGKT